MNFKEYVRVSFDGSVPTGNTNQGSRCSSKHDWHMLMWIEKQGANWGERAGKPNEVQDGSMLMDEADPTP